MVRPIAAQEGAGAPEFTHVCRGTLGRTCLVRLGVIDKNQGRDDASADLVSGRVAPLFSDWYARKLRFTHN
jgi:hypothetical protein